MKKTKEHFMEMQEQNTDVAQENQRTQFEIEETLRNTEARKKEEINRNNN